MNLFRKILVPVDFSERSKDAFRIACSLTTGAGCRLVLLHVVEQTFIAEESVAFGELGIPIPVTAAAPGHLKALRDRLAEEYVPMKPVDMEYDVCEGEPASEIVAAAEEGACDLIVMGTHGRTGLKRLLAGSVAEVVMRKATCPVVTLRSTGLETEEPQTSRAPATVIV